MSSSLFSGLANLTDPLRDAEHGAMRGVFNLRNVRDYLLIFIFIGFFKEEFLTSKVHTLFTYFFLL